jgi:hypothetical protein
LIEAVGSEPNLRSELGTQSPMGNSTTNTIERTLASFGQINGFSPVFGAHNSVDFGGVLLLLPALLAQGLMKIKETHTIKEGYYSLESIVLTLSFMALCRIKNPQQLSQYKSGEMGKLLGYDRIPEMKCLRSKMNELFENKQTFALNNLLVQDWIGESDDLILYTDGHVRVYNGYKAQLPKKHVSRQKLCLAATADFWLNDSLGMPLMKWTGDLNEKLQHMIEFEMIPKLLEQGVIARATAETTIPVCTLIFDREAYAPDFFIRLWTNHRIAIISYRKNVKDIWEASEFKAHTITDSKGLTDDTMHLCEKEVELKGHIFREIRKISDSNHQTAIITTNPTMELAKVAVRMFARWLQENFFKYMMADYSLDHIYQYGVEEIELSEEIVNPAYRSIYNQHKKEKEKLGRLEKELVKNVKLDQDSCLDTFKQNVTNKAKLVDSIEQKRIVVADLKEKRDKLPKKITLADLPEEGRYTTLKKESSYFMATLKMICYRAETALVNMLESKFKNAENEKRSLVKEIIFTSADIKPDLEKKQLVVTLHSMSTAMKNQIVNQLCQELNDSETVFPGTDLTLVYKSIAY